MQSRSELVQGILEGSIHQDLFQLIENENREFKIRILEFVLNNKSQDIESDFLKQFASHNDKCIIEKIYDEYYLELDSTIKEIINFYRDAKSYKCEALLDDGQRIETTELRDVSQKLAADFAKNKGGNFL